MPVTTAAGNDKRGINVAVLSKYPITNVVSNASNRFPVDGKSEGFSRDFLEATVKVSDQFEFTLGTTHLKAQSGGHRPSLELPRRHFDKSFGGGIDLN